MFIKLYTKKFSKPSFWRWEILMKELLLPNKYKQNPELSSFMEDFMWDVLAWKGQSGRGGGGLLRAGHAPHFLLQAKDEKWQTKNVYCPILFNDFFCPLFILMLREFPPYFWRATLAPVFMYTVQKYCIIVPLWSVPLFIPCFNGAVARKWALFLNFFSLSTKGYSKSLGVWRFQEK